MNNNFNTKISKINYLSKDVVEITFKIQDGRMVDFKPGQFILVKISSNPMIMRAYSVLNYDLISNEVTIGVKKVEGGQGTSIIFDTFKLDKSVDIMGPMGDTLIVDKDKKDIVLVATGIGITPIICMLNDLVNDNYDGKITLIYGVRNQEELFYIEEINKAKSKNNNIDFIPVLSREIVDNMEKGYITDVIRNMDLQNKHIYMCSSNKVASSFKDILIELKFDINNFSCESA